jgi:hypothetical protein
MSSRLSVALIVFAVLPVGILPVAAGESKPIELNTIMMESTFKLQGPNAVGTAFILGRPYPKDLSTLRYVLVTAAHVLEEMQGEYVIVHFRRKQEGQDWERIPYRVRIRSHTLPLWTKHPDADIAVMYITVPDGVLSKLVPTTLLADDKILSKFEVHPGDELNCLGYPFGAESNTVGFPILRSGKIASYPLLPTRETKGFLFDFQVFRGNSGGPVYFVQSGRTYGGSTHLGSTIQFLIGLVSRERFITEEIVELLGKREQRHPLGLAEVVHASLIKEAINLLPPPDQVP